MSCVLLSLSLLLIMFWKTTEFDFEPTKQFEGKTVQAQCSVKKLFHGWVTNRDFKRLVSLHFDLSGGAAELGIYYIKENIRAVPLNNRNVHVRFVAGSSRNVTGYNMIVSLHDIRCTDGSKPSYCRLIIEDKQGQTLNLVNKGTLKVLAIPRDVDIETNNKNLDYFDAVPYSTVVLTCKGVAPPNLKVRWVRYFPLYNLAKQTVVEDFRAQKQPSIGKDSLCQKSKVYNYVSKHTVIMTALEHFSVYYCVFYDQKEGSLARSKPVALFMKQNQDDAAKWCKKDYRLDTTTKPRIIITVGESFFSEEFLMSCYSNVTDTQDLYIKFKRERQPSYRLSTSPYIRALRRRVGKEGICYQISEIKWQILESQIKFGDNVSCCRDETLCTYVDLLPFALKEVEKSKCSISEFWDEFPCQTTGFQEYPAGGGTCLLFAFQFSSTWNDSRAICRNHYSSDLIRLDSEDLEDVVDEQLAMSSDGIYIGLHDGIGSDFGWLDDNHTTPRSNWAAGEPRRDESEGNCVYKSPGDWKWKSGLCDEPRAFVCQKLSAQNAGSTQMTITFPFTLKKFYINRSHTIGCSAFTTPGRSSIIFKITAKNFTQHFHDGDSGFSNNGREFVREAGRCLLRARASLVFKPQPQMVNGMLSCCWMRQEDSMSCTSLRMERLYFESQTPVLELDMLGGVPVAHTHKKFHFICAAFVGTGGQLHMSLSTPSTNLTWRIDKHGVTPVEKTEGPVTYILDDARQHELKIDKAVKSSEEPDLGLYIRGELAIEGSEHLSGANLSCSSFCPYNPALNTANKTVSAGPIIIKPREIRHASSPTNFTGPVMRKKSTLKKYIDDQPPLLLFILMVILLIMAFALVAAVKSGASVSTCRCKPPSVCKKTPRSYKHSASFPAGPEHDTDLEPSGEAPDTDEKEQGTTEL